MFGLFRAVDFGRGLGIVVRFDFVDIMLCGLLKLLWRVEMLVNVVEDYLRISNVRIRILFYLFRRKSFAVKNTFRTQILIFFHLC